MNEGLKLSDVVPVLRADLKIGEPTPGRGETTVPVSDPSTGRQTTVRGFELSIMRMLNGKRTAEEVLSAASQIGLPLSLDSLGVFIRRLRKEGFLGEPGSAPQNLLSWEPRNEWNEEIRRLYQEALREARADRLVAAKSRLDTLLARAPGTKEAQQLLHWVMERLRPEGGPKTPLFKDVYSEVAKGWFDEGERQSELNETASAEVELVVPQKRSPVPMIAAGGVLLMIVVFAVVPFPHRLRAKVTFLPISQADVTLPHAGALKELPTVGQFVTKGQVVARFDTAPLEKRLKELDAEIAAADKRAKAPGNLPRKAADLKAKAVKADALAKAAQADVDKLLAKLKGKPSPVLAKAQKKAQLFRAAADAAQKLVDSGAASAPEAAKEELVKLNAEKDRVKAELSASTVIAPAGGEVVAVSAKAGEALAANAQVAKLSDTSSLTVVIHISPGDAKSIKQGSDADLKVGPVRQKLRIERVEADSAQATLLNEKGSFKLNTDAEAELAGESKSIFGRM